MTSRLLHLSVSLLLAFVLLALGLLALRPPLWAHPSIGEDDPEAKFDDALIDAIAEQGDGGPAPVAAIVLLKEQVAANTLHEIVRTATAARPDTEAPPGSAAALVSRHLQQTAVASQAPLVAEIERLAREGTVSTYLPLWIVNGIAVEATPAALEALAARPEVAEVVLDAYEQYVEPEAARSLAAPAGLAWGVEKIRAAHAWHGLGVDGSGATVAIMDTGVDWRHPALRANYRGRSDTATISHSGHWFDPFESASEAPFDPHGHGTHVAGIAVGQGGLGVAPGASWIAVRIFDSRGYSTLSTIHQGFQWLLAPGGIPALAPDVVNGSWGSAGNVKHFLADIRALRAAGIIPIFAAGNGGPFPGTVGAPASYTETLAVAATDRRDTVAWFSSRGPSPLTQRAKPDVAAPGATVPSALPDGNYGSMTGTSMAAPHVAGVAALVRSARPALAPVAVMRTITETAASFSSPPPENSGGAGRVDAYDAVASRRAHGLLVGTVTHAGRPLAAVTVTVTTPAGVPLSLITDGGGRYRAPLLPGAYSLTIAPFGFHPVRSEAVAVVEGETSRHNFRLMRLPGEHLSGVVRDGADGRPLTATLTVVEAGLRVTAAADGAYSLTLPTGEYTLRINHAGYEFREEVLQILPQRVRRLDFDLVPSRSILLVDSGPWYYASYASIYRRALREVGLGFDEWSIFNPVDGAPTADDLAKYDLVIWSAPNDSPGFVGAGGALDRYLRSGGHLLISGQNVAGIDGTGVITFQRWWHTLLQGKFLSEAEGPFTLTGVEGGPFDGLTFTLNGEESADNQQRPDVVEPRVDSLTQAALTYEDGAIAALEAGWCAPFRALFLGFGLEGVATAAARDELLRRALAAFDAPPVASGLQLASETLDDYLVPGQTLTYTLRLRNLSETVTDTVRLTARSADSAVRWRHEIVTPTVTLGPCASGGSAMSVTAPATFVREGETQVRLVAVGENGAEETVIARFQMPGQTLIVDDDRWYDQEPLYRETLDEAGLPYDFWDTAQRGSPPSQLLNAYEFVLWYTGYDWFRPVTAAEAQALTAYLRQGGRLFLTSQDFLYYHGGEELARHYLGVVDYQESLTPTVLYAGDQTVLGDDGKPLTLQYPFRNFGDGLMPSEHSRAFLWHDQGMAAGTATAGAGWRSVFWGFPAEALPASERAYLLDRAIGWLGDLGESTFVVDRRVGPAASRLYTLTLHNLPTAPNNQVAVTNTLPPGLHLAPESLQGGAHYDPATNRIIWRGSIEPGAQHQIIYEAYVDPRLPVGTRIDNEVFIHYQRHDLRWAQRTSTWVSAPDLSLSRIEADSHSLTPGAAIAYTATLEGRDLLPTGAVTATLHLPEPVQLITDTLSASSGTLSLDGKRIVWRGAVGAREPVRITLLAHGERFLNSRRLSTTLIVDDGVTTPLIRSAPLRLEPYVSYLPLIQSAATESN